MDYFRRIQNAIDFIEENLQEELKITDIASAACFSAFHFQRLFRAISGFSVYAYIRERRLTEAAKALRETKRTLLDIAITYQYGSQEAFTRAFERYFSCSPLAYRKMDVPLRGRERARFLDYRQYMRKEVTMHKPEILLLDDIQLVGREYRTTLDSDQYFRDIPRFYKDFGANEHYLRIPNRAKPDLAYGVACHFADDESFSFLIGEEVSSVDPEPVEGLVPFVVPGGKYAMFKVGPLDEAQDVRRYIYGTWLPHSHYERREGPDFEVTDVCHNYFSSGVHVIIYIPLQ
ncbi:AraC family transcriptional regulator [Thermosporothrix hazakensis]|jgi:AraC family transcriptional regulator|uniref:AraC family transcriptional regulator n=1 Tax=Thermosporothrix hazakensis TaxID=644383 RepID=A0A326U7Y9_THEHA|nr:effector binding domain-containing protein [Thermosporothrix hazakensis]PZW31188.1 AraC family transcriptional regulator [Thermosporothrix hazakensis]GCE50901.1 AraC family transcriptional regulator [Thermosporothrix hazakensis]